jgi:hypothetical protein
VDNRRERLKIRDSDQSCEQQGEASNKAAVTDDQVL